MVSVLGCSWAISDGKDQSKGSRIEKYGGKGWQGMRPGKRTSKLKHMEGKERRLILIDGFSLWVFTSVSVISCCLTNLMSLEQPHLLSLPVLWVSWVHFLRHVVLAVNADIGRIPWCWAPQWPTHGWGWHWLSAGSSARAVALRDLDSPPSASLTMLVSHSRCARFQEEVFQVHKSGNCRSIEIQPQKLQHHFYKSMQIMGLVKIQGEKKNGKEFEATFNLPQLPFPIT